MSSRVSREAAAVWLEQAVARGVVSGGVLQTSSPAAEDFIFAGSVTSIGPDTLALAKLAGPAGTCLVVFGPNKSGFRGVRVRVDGTAAVFCAADHANAQRLRRVAPFTAPSRLAEEPVTVGLGDRLGIASPGHLRVVAPRAVAPVLAQQSVRELSLTRRTYENVLDAATWAVFQEGYRHPWGADGDHLKSADWVRKAVRLGFSMITADVSDHIRKEYDTAPVQKVLETWDRLPAARRADLEGRYLPLEVTLDTGDKITFSREVLARIVLVYADALDAAEALYRAGVRAGGGVARFDFELSVDETSTPTLPEAHVFVASEMQRRDVPLFSLAPRFVGEFQKGIDYIGDVGEFEKSFRIHAAIARHFGYRISVHSGSDKFAVFPIVGRETRGTFHLKTAGTNWLEALAVIQEKDPELFRRLYARALAAFPATRRYYHITPNLANVPPAETLDTGGLAAVLANPDARQVLHVSYGEILKDRNLREALAEVLATNIEAYWASVARHIGRHLDLLGVGAR